MSRVKLCDAWQIAFNRLIYYASFVEENSVHLDIEDVTIFKKEFTVVSPLLASLEPLTLLVERHVLSVH